MFKVLFKSRMQSLSYFYLNRGMASKKKGAKKNSKGLAVGMAFLFVYLFAVFFGMFYGLFSVLIAPLQQAGVLWLYFGIASLLIITLCFFMSVFTTQAQLYEAKDNEMLISMPIKPIYILISRMLMLLLINFIFEALVAIPVLIVYLRSGFATAAGVVLFLISLLLLPVLAQTISCIAAYIVVRVTSRMRNKSALTAVFTLAFLGVYFWGYSKINTAMNFLATNGAQISASVKKAIVVYWYGSGIADANILNFVLFALCAIIPFAIVCFILAKSFIKIATTKQGMTKKKFKGDSIKSASLSSALVRRELNHFTSSAIYMTNCGLGLVFTLALPVAAIVKKATIVTALGSILDGEIYKNLYVIAAFMLAFLASMTDISAPSVSLEGKNLWIVKSMPVSEMQVIMAKVKAHLYLAVPVSIIAPIIIAVGFEFTVIQTLLLIVTTVLSAVFSALFGVVCNLKFPKLEWINETQPVKQGISIVATMFGTMGVVAVPAIVFIAFLWKTVTPFVFMLIFAAYFVALCALLYLYIVKKGVKIFRGL